MTSVLVTGASGFIGKQLCAELVGQGFKVFGLTRNLLGMAETLREVHWIKADLTGDELSEAPLGRVDVVVHLAARVHLRGNVKDSTTELAAYQQVNRDATLSLARQAAKRGVKRFVFLSTIGVLGDSSTNIPLTASDVINPQNSYAQSKAEAEIELRRFLSGSPMELVIIRPPLVYGSDAPGNFGRLLRLVETHLPLPFGSVRNRRSLISVYNLTDLIITCLVHPSAAGEVFLASDDQDISTTDLIRTMIHFSDSRSVLVPLPVTFLTALLTVAGKYTMTRQLFGSLELDISHTRAVLDWTPPLTFTEGIRQVYGR